MRPDRNRLGRRMTAALAVVVAASFTLVGSSSIGAVAAPVVHRVSARPAWATSQNLSAHVAANQVVSFDVVLGWTDPAGVAALAKAVSDPASPSYRHYLTPAAFMARFSQPASAVDAVNAWLTSQGLTPGAAPLSRLFVPASGTTAQIEHAFGTTLNFYRTGNRLTRAPSSDAIIPASLAGVVQGIVGLTATRMRPSTPAAPPPGAFRAATPCSLYWGEKMATTLPTAYGHTLPYAPCGYTPQQIQGAYGLTSAINSGIDGTGQTVAIIDAFAAPTIRHDLVRYSSLHGLPVPNLKQYNATQTPGDAANKQGWYGEETLDLDAVHSTAPGAKLVYEGTKDSFDLSFLSRYSDILDHHRASIVTNSYGDVGEQGIPKSEIDTEDAMFQQAAAEGIGFFFSSGDCGDEIDPQGACGGSGFRTADFEASDPNVTAVGGTSLAVGQGGNYMFETGWGTHFSGLSANGLNWRPTLPGFYLYGSGGGPSHLFPQPWYQVGVVPDSMSNAYGSERRVVPDIAADGDPNTGFLVGETQTFLQGQVRYDEYRIGGTSLSSPLMAGMMADANQEAGIDLGFVNPLIYSLGGSSAFHDIVNPASTVAVARTNWANGVNQWNGRTYSVRTMNQTGTLHTMPGYDDVTGLGTPNGWAFLRAMAGK
jgi:subtilase family serine protease